MKFFKIPIAEEWYPKKDLNIKVKIHSDEVTKPEWVKVLWGEDGIPYLAAEGFYIWFVRPIPRKVYNSWLNEAMEADEIIH